MTQNGLNGHAIAVSDASLEVLRILGVVSDDEAEKRKVPGLERAIAKNKGVEFGSLLHQLGADYAAAPFSPRVRAVLLEIAPDAKDRFPKRAGKKNADEGEAPAGGRGNRRGAGRSRSQERRRPSPRTPRRKSRSRRTAPKPESTKKPPAEDKKKSHAQETDQEETAVTWSGGERRSAMRGDFANRPMRAPRRRRRAPLRSAGVPPGRTVRPLAPGRCQPRWPSLGAGSSWACSWRLARARRGSTSRRSAAVLCRG